MTSEEIKKFLAGFVKSEEWRKIREVLLWKLDAPCWMVDGEGNYIMRVTQDKSYCGIMKAVEKRKRMCEEYYQGLQREVMEKGRYVVKPCHAGFLGFQSPILIDGNIVGGVGASQMIDHDRDPALYKEYAEGHGIMGEEFLSYLDEREAISQWLLETEVGLITLLAQSSVDLVIRSNGIQEREILMRNLIEFYRLIGEKKGLMFELEEEKLYEAIVDIASRSIDAEICSLMMINPKTQLLEIKAAVGLSKEVIDGTKMRVGEGVAGYVVASGKPLLVRDITKDERFRHARSGSPRYYTNSLVSSPIRIKGKVVGVLNMNNEVTRRIFNEGDLRLLTIIAEHASMTIEGSERYREEMRKQRIAAKTHEERAEEMRAEAERLRVQAKFLRSYIEEAQRIRKEAEEAKQEAEEVRRLREEAERLREEAKKAKELARQEQLKEEAARLAVQADKMEEVKEEELLKREAERLKVQVEKLRGEEERLKRQIRDAEELIAQATQAGELKEETERLRAEIEKMKRQEEILLRQIEETEELRARAEEAKQLKAQTDELSHLYELSKEIVQMEDPRQILEWLLTKTLTLFDYHVGAYLLLDNNSLYGQIKHVYSLTDECVDDIKERMLANWKSVDPDREMRGKRKVEIVVDEKTMGEDKGTYQGKIARLVFSPILDRGRITGVLYLGNFTKDGFVEKTRRLLPTVSSHASIAIEKARRYLETKELAEKDELTGVYNFRYFGKFFTDEFKRVKRYNRELSLLMLDFDYLKKFNDTFGHEEGNRLIRTIAKLMKENVREVDCLARFGGDEFAVALPETGLEAAKDVAERILDSIRTHDYRIGEKSFRITASIGLASFPHVKAKGPKELFMRADEALYQAKQRGRNQVYAYGE
jgi:diguanylate cyclase (GGDEF)-like protein